FNESDDKTTFLNFAMVADPRRIKRVRTFAVFAGSIKLTLLFVYALAIIVFTDAEDANTVFDTLRAWIEISQPFTPTTSQNISADIVTVLPSAKTEPLTS